MKDASEKAWVKSGETKSDEVDTAGHSIIGILLPSLDSCNITFEVSESKSGVYYPVKNKDGTIVTVSAGTGNFAISADDLTPICAYRYFKLVCSITQTADRKFTVNFLG